MHLSNRGSLRQQVRFLQRQFLQEGNLPFTDVLSQEVVSQALTAAGVAWKDRIYSPLVTLWVFLSQVLSADHSCRSAVARLIAFRISRGQEACSSRTGAYCQARERLPEKFFSAITCLAGKALNSQVDPSWLWKGRSVYMFDGTTVSMPDTVANQRDFPQTPNQRTGTRLPDRTHWSNYFAVLRRDPESWLRQVCWQGGRRSRYPAEDLACAFTRRHSARRSTDIQLDQHRHAAGARYRTGEPAQQGASQSRLSQGNPLG